MEKKAIIRDLTRGSVPRTLFSFSLPLFLSGLLQMVYNMVDMIVVGNFVGTNGLSAVSVGGEVLMLITFVAMGFSNAGQILISRYVGARRYDQVGEMVGTLFTLLESLAVIIMVIFLFSYQEVLRWLNTPEDIGVRELGELMRAIKNAKEIRMLRPELDEREQLLRLRTLEEKGAQTDARSLRIEFSPEAEEAAQ